MDSLGQKYLDSREVAEKKKDSKESKKENK